MAASKIPTTPQEVEENIRRMERGELYYAFTPDLIDVRRQCAEASDAFNNAPKSASRRELIELWKKITRDDSPLPPKLASVEEDDAQLAEHPWVDAPVRLDYGYNVKLGPGVYINSRSTWIDTCPITVGARTIVGPNCSFYSGVHPLDGRVRNGLKGPEFGKPITIGEDCWIAGNVTILAGVTIGANSTVGAGSVVTKDVPPGVVVVGNPARILKEVKEGS